MSALRILFNTIRESEPPIPAWRTCCLLLLGIAILTLCGTFFWLFGGIDALQSWAKSLEFPAIEGHYQPFVDALAGMTNDVLISEDRGIDNMYTMTHSNEYTGCVGGYVDRFYGTNRPFDSVLATNAKFMTLYTGWKPLEIGLESPDYFRAVTPTGGIVIEAELANRTLYINDWAKFQTVYDIKFFYYEPGLGCRG